MRARNILGWVIVLTRVVRQGGGTKKVRWQAVGGRLGVELHCKGIVECGLGRDKTLIYKLEDKEPDRSGIFCGLRLPGESNES